MIYITIFPLEALRVAWYNRAYDMHRFLPISSFMLAAAPLMAQGPAAAPASHVQVEKAITGKDTVSRVSIGHAEAVRTMNVIAAVEGFITEVAFTEGSFVQQGDVLVRINPIRYEAALKQAKADVAQLDAQIIYAENRYKRLSALAAAAATSQETLETALAQLEGLKARRAGAQAEVVRAQKNLDDCSIRAEVSGRIGRLALCAGNYVSQGEQLATLTQVDPIYVRFPLSQHDVDAIFRGPEHIGEVADIRLITAAGLPYPSAGKVAIVDNKLTGTTDTYTLWASFDNGEHILTDKSIAAVRVSLNDTETVCMVPLTAVHHDAQGAFVYTVEEGSGTVARRDVTSGNIQGRYQTIYDGLQEGETVITDGSHKTRVGADIVPVYPEAQSDTRSTASAETPAALPVETAEVCEISDPTVISCQGARVEAVSTIHLRPLVQGLLQSQDFREGDTVSKDQVLFRIDTTRYKAAVDVCKSEIAQLEVSIRDARSKYERQQQLHAKGVSSRDELESAKATLDEALARKQKAEAALTIAEDDLSRCVIRAGLPNARIGRVNVTPGNYITDLRSPLASLIQLSPIYVRFPLSETVILSTFGTDERFMEEARISLTTATGKIFEETGHVSFCDNTVKPATATQNVWATFANAEGQLSPGSVVSIRITRDPEVKVPAVPAAAVQTDTRGRFVWVADEGRAHKAEILIGGTDAEGRTAVFHGLMPGQKVILTNLAELEEGMEIQDL